ncbi:MAG: DUF1232 domain-containing protein [Paludibacteraceae bacterium]|nr:DUF1232 domain-containing protein [Paludibacteraceae bacterium]
MKQNEIKKYEGNYSDSGFWGKLAKFALKIGEPVVYNALLLFYLLKSPNCPVQQKTLILGALGYLIFPVDLIPDAILLLGFTDDAGALATVIKVVKNNITPEVENQAKEKLAEWF